LLKTNVVNDNDIKKIMLETLKFLSDSLSKTLGPYGSTTIIQDRMIHHTITKDGYTILNKIFIEEEESRTILDLVKKISRNLVRKVGDGSTSSIVIANSLYNSLINIMEIYKISAKDLLDLLERISNILIKELKMMATPIDDNMDKLEYIATISTNNDETYGKLITEVFRKIGRFGFINIEKSKTEKTYFDMTRGFEISRGYVNSLMANQADEKTCEYFQPFILMCDSYIDENDIPFVAEIAGNVCNKMGQPFVIIAKGFDNASNVFFQVNLMKNKIPLLAIDIATESKRSKDTFNDLALNLGCNVLKKSEGESINNFELSRLGRCTRVVSTEGYTRFFEGQGDKDLIRQKIEVLIESINEMTRSETYIDLDTDIYDLKRRIALLGNSMATLYVGGITEDAKETDKYLIEDAVFACKSALNHGYILGGNLAVPFILKKDTVINDIITLHENKDLAIFCSSAIFDAFIESFSSVIKNYTNDKEYIDEIIKNCLRDQSIFNLKTLKYEKAFETNIINSAETDIEILKSAISIIGLLATSNQFIKINLKA